MNQPAILITRHDYLTAHRTEQPDIHARYYAQFVTEQTIQNVVLAFGVDLLTKELKRDRHLNGIALARWDALCAAETPTGFRTLLPFNRDLLAPTGESVTRATLVCIAKSAARIAVDRARGD